MAALDLYLMSPPGPRWALRGKANFRSAEAAPVDPQAALAEWISLADAIEARGGRVVCVVPPDDSTLTGLPYAAECGQILPGSTYPFFLLPNMKPEHRQGERELWKQAAESMGMTALTLRHTWEAMGDVAFFRSRCLRFFGGRTTREGALEAAERFASQLDEPLYLEIREPAFHGNMAVLPLPAADRLLVCPDVLVGKSMSWLESAFGKDRLLPVSVEEIRAYATNGLPIGRDVLAPHLTPPRVQELLRSLGLTVVILPMVELCEKAGGASRCLVSQATVDSESITIPASLDYRLRRAELVARLPEAHRRRLQG